MNRRIPSGRAGSLLVLSGPSGSSALAGVGAGGLAAAAAVRECGNGCGGGDRSGD